MPRRRRPVRAGWTGGLNRLALGVIAVHLVVRAWLMLPGEYWQDDFVFLRRARATSLSWDFVFHDHNGHIIPVPFLLTWVLAHVHAYLPAALVMLALQALASTALWLLLRTVVGPRPAMLVGLAIALFTPLMFSTVTWWAAGAMMLGLQLAMALAGHAHVMFQRTGRWPWLVGGVLSLLLGLAFWEKAVLIPVFLVVLTLLESGTPGRTARTAVRLWPAWLAYAVVTLGYLAFYLQVASVGGAQARDVHDVLSLARHQAIDVFARGLIGGPWHGVTGTNPTWLESSAFGLVVVLQLLVAFGILAHRVSGARSLLAWGALVGYLALDVALTALGRGLFFVFVQMDPRYVCDAVPVAAVCVAVMLTPRAGRAVRLPRWLTGGQVVAVAVFAAIVLLFNSSMVTASAMAGALHRPEVSRYVANARKSLEREPGLTLYDGFVPASIMIGAFPPEERRVSSVLGAYGVEPRYDLPSQRLRVLDDKGVAHPVRLGFAQTGRIDSGDGCGVRLDPGHPQEVVGLGGPVSEGSWVLRLDYFAGSDAVVDVVTTGRPRPVGLLAGQRSVLVPVSGGTSSVELVLVRGDSAVCATGLAVGYPLPETS